MIREVSKYINILNYLMPVVYHCSKHWSSTFSVVAVLSLYMYRLNGNGIPFILSVQLVILGNQKHFVNIDIIHLCFNRCLSLHDTKCSCYWKLKPFDAGLFSIWQILLLRSFCCSPGTLHWSWRLNEAFLTELKILFFIFIF